MMEILIINMYYQYDIMQDSVTIILSKISVNNIILCKISGCWFRVGTVLVLAPWTSAVVEF
jgi:hypothetical protein